jgi:hypothetical protein
MRGIMKRWMGIVAVLACYPALASDYDGSKLLICAPVEAMECVSGDGCERKLPAEIGAPAFMRIDISKKVVVGPKQTSPILLVKQDEEQVMLQGNERGFGWTIVLDQEDGSLVATLANNSGAFVLFGSCTPL